MKFDISEPVLVRHGAHAWTRVSCGKKEVTFLPHHLPTWVRVGGFVLKELNGKYLVQDIDRDAVYWFDAADLESAL